MDDSCAKSCFSYFGCVSLGTKDKKDKKDKKEKKGGLNPRTIKFLYYIKGSIAYSSNTMKDDEEEELAVKIDEDFDLGNDIITL